jgi:hypothetical protein
MRQRYEIGKYSYPEGIGTNQDLQHSVTFFINVRKKSKFYKSQRDSTVKNPGQSAGNSNRNTPLVGTLDSFTRAEAAVLLSAGAVSASKLSTAINAKTVSNVIDIGRKAATAGLATAAVGTFIVGAVNTAVNMYDTLKSDNLEALKDYITLHMENAPSVSYGVNYQDKDMGILGGFLNPGASAGNSTGGQNGINSELGAAALLQVAKIPSILPGFGSASLSDIAQFGGKVKTNPFREVFFEGVDYRKFNFKYTFYPKNARESQNVRRIIDLFKEHMHPELSAGGYFYVYPSEFEIKYYYKNAENGYFNRIAPCVLTSMSVDYGGSQFSSFSDGAPTQVSMSLSFRELELLTKESIRTQGY